MSAFVGFLGEAPVDRALAFSGKLQRFRKYTAWHSGHSSNPFGAFRMEYGSSPVSSFFLKVVEYRFLPRFIMESLSPHH